MNINNSQNQMNYTNNFYQTDKMNIKNNNMYYQIRNNQPNYTNINNSLDTYDKRLVLCLKYLGLNKYVPNFIKRGIRFEDFLSFSNNDLASLKIPSKIQEIIQKFILSYLNYGSMYTVEEIVQFFKTRRVKKYFPKDNGLNINDRNKEYINNIKYKSVNQRRDYNNNHYTNLGGYNNIQRNVDNNLNEKRRPKSQSNTIIRNQNYDMKKNQIIIFKERIYQIIYMTLQQIAIVIYLPYYQAKKILMPIHLPLIILVTWPLTKVLNY